MPRKLRRSPLSFSIVRESLRRDRHSGQPIKTVLECSYVTRGDGEPVGMLARTILPERGRWRFHGSPDAFPAGGWGSLLEAKAGCRAALRGITDERW